MAAKGEVLKPETLSVEKVKLLQPPLSELAQVLEKGLSKNFKEAAVRVVTCPDLTKEPFQLSAPGLGGSPGPYLVDLGGVPNIEPTPDLTRVYRLSDLPSLIGLEKGPTFLVGAGAGPWPHFGVNCELMANLLIDENGDAENSSRVSMVGPQGECQLNVMPPKDTRCALMANLLASRGQVGPVLEVRCSNRTGEENFVTCMRKTLAEKYGTDPVALGGTFLLRRGKAKCHVMPDFSKEPLLSPSDTDKWLKFYDFPSPIVFLSVFISHDPNLALRVEHSHGYGPNVGGHYHYDVTPDDVEYIAYFATAETVIRVDRPKRN